MNSEVRAKIDSGPGNLQGRGQLAACILPGLGRRCLNELKRLHPDLRWIYHGAGRPTGDAALPGTPQYDSIRRDKLLKRLGGVIGRLFTEHFLTGLQDSYNFRRILVVEKKTTTSRWLKGNKNLPPSLSRSFSLSLSLLLGRVHKSTHLKLRWDGDEWGK